MAKPWQHAYQGLIEIKLLTRLLNTCTQLVTHTNANSQICPTYLTNLYILWTKFHECSAIKLDKKYFLTNSNKYWLCWYWPTAVLLFTVTQWIVNSLNFVNLAFDYQMCFEMLNRLFWIRCTSTSLVFILFAPLIFIVCRTALSELTCSRKLNSSPSQRTRMRK